MSDVKTYYEKYWEKPTEYYDPTSPQRLALLERHAGHLLKAGTKVLDVGCGRGEFTAFFGSKGCAAEGIDISQTGIEYARQQHPGVTFHVGVVETLLPARKGAFDVLFSSEVIEHLFDPGTYLAAMNQLLRPGGTLVLTTPYHGLIKNILVDLTNYSKHYDPLGQHIRFFDQRSLNRCLEQFGYRAKVWTGYGRPWPLWKSFFVVAEKTRDVEIPVGGAVE